MKAEQVNIRNRRARFDYEITDTYVAGMVLTGTEIKSIRDGKASLADSYCLVENGEVWVKGMNISEYFYGSYNNHVARRDRKLLLNKKEIRETRKKRQGDRIYHYPAPNVHQRPRTCKTRSSE